MSNGLEDNSVARSQTNVLQPEYIPARILWPALGCPEIVDPAKAGAQADSTSSIRVVLVASRKELSAVDVARHLRWSAWSDRRTRFLDPGTRSFQASDLKVSPVAFANAGSPLTYRFLIANGAISMALAKDVWALYQGIWGQSVGLYEIVVSQSASSAVPAGLNHIFWVNRRREDTPNDPSEEMHSLIEKFVKPRLAKEFPPSAWVNVPASVPYKNSDEMVRDYEFEWSAPPNFPALSPDRRVEVLHPLVIASAAGQLSISHVTDIHIGVREEVYEDRAHHVAPVSESLPDLDQDGHSPNDDDRLLRDYEKKATEPLLPRSRWKAFNNPNRRFEEIYRRAKDSDVLLFTGDLIDFGRGHVGDSNTSLGNIDNYWLDRNWFLFYKLLASVDLYHKPVFTNLGNHDWRLNPYPPLGQYKTNANYNLTEAELERIHGPNAKVAIYHRVPGEYLQCVVEWITQPGMPETGMPLVTTIQSVIWYLLLINPFLDYSVQLPGGYALLMLDWGRDENTTVLSAKVAPGKPHWGIITSYDPVAAQSLSPDQKALVTHFVGQRAQAKILGVHAPLIGPNSSWPTDQMQTGSIKETGLEYPIIAMGDPAVEDTPFPPYTRPAYGSIKNWLYWILRQLRDNKVSLVLAGHLHRHAMFVIANPKKAKPHQKLQDGMALCFPAADLSTVWSDHGPPVFINSTCAGPVGHDVPIHGHPEEKVRPGYSQITIKNDGTVFQIQEQYGDWTL